MRCCCYLQCCIALANQRIKNSFKIDVSINGLSPLLTCIIPLPVRSSGKQWIYQYMCEWFTWSLAEPTDIGFLQNINHSKKGIEKILGIHRCKWMSRLLSLVIFYLKSEFGPLPSFPLLAPRIPSFHRNNHLNSQAATISRGQKASGYFKWCYTHSSLTPFFPAYRLHVLIIYTNQCTAGILHH